MRSIGSGIEKGYSASRAKSICFCRPLTLSLLKIKKAPCTKQRRRLYHKRRAGESSGIRIKSFGKYRRPALPLAKSPATCVPPKAGLSEAHRKRLLFRDKVDIAYGIVQRDNAARRIKRVAFSVHCQYISLSGLETFETVVTEAIGNCPHRFNEITAL